VDEATGTLLEVLAQFGTDSGIKHYIEITDDIIGDRPLVNFRKYYFAVTAYAYKGWASRRVTESDPIALKIVPGVPGVGSELNADHLDVLEVEHLGGNADALFYPIIIDPYLLTNHNYEISFLSENESVNKWVLTDLNSGIVIKENTTFPVTEDYLELFTRNGNLEASEFSINSEITDGFIFVSENATFIVPTTFDEAEEIVDLDSTTQIVFEGFHPGSSDGTWVSFLETLTDIPPDPLNGKPDVTKLRQDLELRFTEEGSIGIFYNRLLTVTDTIRVPFELWSVEDNPHQINVAVYSIGSNKKPLFEKAPGSNNGYQLRMNVNFIPVYAEYDESAVLTHSFHWAADSDKMGWMLYFNKNMTFHKDKTVWEIGNVFRLTVIDPVIPGDDVYTFTANGLLPVDKNQMKDQLKEIKVFPNPFFGQFPKENPQGRKVYFSHLGIGKTTIRIYSLSGNFVAKIVKDIESENSPDNQAEWDLRNQLGNPVASGMYLAHFVVEDSNGKKIGERILKLAIF